MEPETENAHSLETYKSLIQLAVESLKLLALLNGGAAIALLAYLGNAAGKNIPMRDMRLPMGCFVAGLFFCGLAFVSSYMTQFRLYNESVGRGSEGPMGPHTHWLWLTMSIVLLSLGMFAFGCFLGVSRFR
jgi:hypothetical protein